MSLHFKNGKFTILLISDSHGSADGSSRYYNLISFAIARTNPDFVVFNGDQFTAPPDRAAEALDHVLRPVNEAKLPFAFTFGNHDCEDGQLQFQEQFDLYKKYPNCLAVHGPDDLPGIANYNILVKDSNNEKNILNLWFQYAGKSDVYSTKSQVDFYRNECHRIKEENGKTIPAIWFQHKAVPEIYKLFKKDSFPTVTTAAGKGMYRGSFYYPNKKFKWDKTGLFLEGPDVPMRQSDNCGLYDAWLEEGDVFAAFYGHNHGDSFLGWNHEDGIAHGFDSSSGFGAYLFPGLDRGCRYIEIYENDIKNFKSEMLYYYNIVPGANVTKLVKMLTHGNLLPIYGFVTRLFPCYWRRATGKVISKIIGKRLGFDEFDDDDR